MMQIKSMSPFINKTQTYLDYLVPDFEKYVKMYKDLYQNFSKRFQDLNGQEMQMNLFQIPFGVNVEKVNVLTFQTCSQTKLCTTLSKENH